MFNQPAFYITLLKRTAQKCIWGKIFPNKINSENIPKLIEMMEENSANSSKHFGLFCHLDPTTTDHAAKSIGKNPQDQIRYCHIFPIYYPYTTQ